MTCADCSIQHGSSQETAARLREWHMKQVGSQARTRPSLPSSGLPATWATHQARALLQSISRSLYRRSEDVCDSGWHPFWRGIVLLRSALHWRYLEQIRELQLPARSSPWSRTRTDAKHSDEGVERGAREYAGFITGADSDENCSQAVSLSATSAPRVGGRRFCRVEEAG